MIIKGLRIRSRSGIRRIIRHLQNGDDNEEVIFLTGLPADIEDMHKDALAQNATYSVRHWIIAPHEHMDRTQLQHVLNFIAEEFGFLAGQAVIVEHRKKRSTEGAANVHWHVLVGEVDPASRRILKSSFDWILHELVARVSEYTFGHKFVGGKHTKSVINGLRKRGMTHIADKLALTLLPATVIPAEAFTHSQHQQKKCLGLDLPAIRQKIKVAVNLASSRAELESALDSEKLEVRKGDKPGTWIVLTKADGILVGALHRLASKQKSIIDSLMRRNASNIPTPLQTLHDDAPLRERRESTPSTVVADPPKSSFLHMVRDLGVMESEALIDFVALVPEFNPTPAMKALANELISAKARLATSRSERQEIVVQLSSAPPARWWCYFFGLADKRLEKIRGLEAALAAAKHEQQLAKIQVSGREAALKREEKNAQEAHAELVRTIKAKNRKAGEILQRIDLAKLMLEETPELADKGMAYLMSAAETRLKCNAVTELASDFGITRSPKM